MRDLDNRDLITGDFLLISGDVVSNVSIESALAKHRARREKNKDAIMTMLLREAGTGHRTKSKGSRPVFFIEPGTERCLYYEEMGNRRGRSRHITIDPELLTSNNEIDVRDDLIDCHIDICTLDVLAQWSDNFDFQSLRNSFLHGVLKDYETYGKTIHTHVMTNQYAARVKSLRAYNAICKDVMGRWTYPFCPDSNLVPDHSYCFGKDQVYKEDTVEIGRASIKRAVIGSHTSVGDDSIITGSTIGRRCKIGRNVIIEGAYIWDDVIVGDDSIIREAIIASDTIIGSNCTVESGALISFGVNMPDHIGISMDRKITRHQESFFDTRVDPEDSDTSSIASSHLIYRHPSASSSASAISTLASSEDDLGLVRDSSRRSSFRSDPSDDAGETRDFHVEATASILDGLQKGDPADTIILELNGYRMSTNASQHEVRKAVVAAFMRRVSNLSTGDNAPSMSAREAVRQVFSKYQGLVERTMFDKDEDEKVDQVDFLLLIQKEVLGRPNGDHLLLFVIKEMYDSEIVEEDGVLQWWDNGRSAEGEMGRVRGLTEPFITFLRNAEEDDESEEGEEEDDEDMEN